MNREIELLAPARDANVAIAAIHHGADAVYIGGPSHGARAAASTGVADIVRVVAEAHRYNVRVYVTLNTLVYPGEEKHVEQLVWQLYRAGVDALIVQDMGLLRMHLPPIELHASTQCDTRGAAKAKMLEQAGFSQIVVARELTPSEIAEVAATLASARIEAFVHGALCVCYSGDCRASLYLTGRSANRGECAQICRYAFDLIDGDGNIVMRNKHLLSLRDMNRSARVADMINAGVSSLKIEGRLKDAAYVKNVTAHYHRLLEDMGVARTSAGRVTLTFVPDASRSFNRGFTDYFITKIDKTAATKSESTLPSNTEHGTRIASIHTPKSQGIAVARVTGYKGNAMVVEPMHELHNGDGLTYIDRGEFIGFRLNRVDSGNILYPATAVHPPVGTVLRRNHDKAFVDHLATDTASRVIDIDLTLRRTRREDGIALDITDTRGNSITVAATLPEVAEARTPQADARRRVLTKTGGTIYSVREITDLADPLFIPASILADLRRAGIEALDRSQRMRYSYRYRAAEDAALVTPECLTFHDNVANPLAEEFYRSHGTRRIEPAAEIKRPSSTRIMTTRYCLRRELGQCPHQQTEKQNTENGKLKAENGKQKTEPGTLRLPLTLVSGTHRFALTFDCKNCRMHVDLQPPQPH